VNFADFAFYADPKGHWGRRGHNRGVERCNSFTAKSCALRITLC